MTTLVLLQLADISVRATAVALLVAAVMVLARVRSGPARHAAWTAVLVAMLTMPLLSATLPALEIRWPASSRARESVTATARATSVTGAAVDASAISGAAVVAPRASELPKPATSWGGLILAVYVAGIIVQVGRMVAGSLGIRRIVRAVESNGPGDRDLLVSPAVLVPLVVGVWRPRIVVPSAWTSWSASQRVAVLAHERAHIRRRDPLVLGVAYLNCCLFWFHPLAWWLRRQLSITAEHACDEAGVRAVGEPRQYAEALLAVADTASRERGRVRWPAVAIDGANALGVRIDRVMDGPPPSTSLIRKLMLGVGCAAAVGVVAACRQTPPPLAADPQVAAELAGQRALQQKRVARQAAVNAMDAAGVAALEAKVQAAPQDLEARGLLLEFYRQRGAQVLDREKVTVALRGHALWVIEHRPESELARSFSPSPQDSSHETARRLWQKHLTQPGASAQVTYNAATFLRTADPPEAERLLLQVMNADPDGPQPRVWDGVIHPPWVNLLSDVYTDALLDAHPTPPSTARPDALAFAAAVQRKLEVSQDARLLSQVGGRLTRVPRRSPVVAALGQTYVEHARQLDPVSTSQWVPDADSPRERMRERSSALRRAQLALVPDLAPRIRRGETLTERERALFLSATAEALTTFSEEQRGSLLPQLAAEMYTMGEYWDTTQRNATAAAREWVESRRYADEGIALARRYESQPEFAGAHWSLTLTLGVHALRDGGRAAALRHLRSAAELTPYPEHGYPMESRFLSYLLSAGERQSVIDYLERSAVRQPLAAVAKARDVEAIRAGKMPEFYQRRMTSN